MHHAKPFRNHTANFNMQSVLQIRLLLQSIFSFNNIAKVWNYVLIAGSDRSFPRKNNMMLCQYQFRRRITLRRLSVCKQ